MFMLDTNTIVYFLKKQGRVIENFEAVSSDSICIPTVVIYELEVGLAKAGFPRGRVRQIEELLKNSRISVFDEAAASASALVRANLEQRGTPIGPVDMLIAGSAISLGATVVTHNTKEFARVEGLQLVDWF